MPSIVDVNVTVNLPPLPPTLQKSGAMVSQGGTNLSVGEFSLLTQASDLTPLLAAPAALTSLTWSGNVVTAATTAPHNLPVGQVVPITIEGAAPAGYNGTFQATITGASAFTYPLLNSPGSETTPGSWVSGSAAELVQMASTFFGMGSTQAVYVIELGAVDVTHAVAALEAYITANPNSAYTAGAMGYFYSYMVPRAWDDNAAFLTMIALYEGTTARTYFWTTTTLATYQAYTALMKDVFALIEAPVLGQYPANVLTAISYSNGVVTGSTTTAHGVVAGQWFQINGCTPTGYNGWHLALPGTTGSTLVYNLATNPGAETVLGTLVANYIPYAGIGAQEFSIAAPFWVSLNYNPSGTNRVGPFNYTFLFGVTPFPTRNNNALLTTLQQSDTSVVGTGAEGGISDTLIWGGKMKDSRPLNFWYAVDWVTINLNENVSNIIINGSNNPINPLYNNQDGVNRLQLGGADTMSQAVNFGLSVFLPVQTSLDGDDLIAALDAGTFDQTTVVNAIPWVNYYSEQENPGDYAIGEYDGLSVSFVPQLGFDHVDIDVNVSELV